MSTRRGRTHADGLLSWCLVGVMTRKNQILLASLAFLVLLSQVTQAAYWDDDYRDVGEYGGFEGDEEPFDTEQDDPQDSQLVTLFKRYYRGWGHRSRFPWKRLPHRICYRQRCKRDKDCCYRWNLCDKSAQVCTDCWYGSRCKSEAECCARYPYCVRVWKKHPSGKRYIADGKCVGKL